MSGIVDLASSPGQQRLDIKRYRTVTLPLERELRGGSGSRIHLPAEGVWSSRQQKENTGDCELYCEPQVGEYACCLVLDMHCEVVRVSQQDDASNDNARAYC